MKYIECPNHDPSLDRANCLFLAGSISGAFNWQNEAAKALKDSYHIFNPRRKDYDITDSSMEREQISWEFDKLNHFCKNILFWFSYETVAPITLFEYGKVLARADEYTNIFVGVHPNYPRIRDVIIQTELERPEIKITKSFSNLMLQAHFRAPSFKKDV